MNTRSFLLSALISGVLIGLFGNLPLLNIINCCLCVWVWAGGFLSVFLYRRYERGQSVLTLAQGAGLGAVAGLIGVFVGLVIYPLTSFISMPVFDSLARTLNIQGDLPFRSGDLGSIAISTLVFFILDIIAYPLFGAISGLIAASIFKDQPATI
jgi:hypothetical protein